MHRVAVALLVIACANKGLDGHLISGAVDQIANLYRWLAARSLGEIADLLLASAYAAYFVSATCAKHARTSHAAPSSVPPPDTSSLREQEGNMRDRPPATSPISIDPTRTQEMLGALARDWERHLCIDGSQSFSGQQAEDLAAEDMEIAVRMFDGAKAGDPFGLAIAIHERRKRWSTGRRAVRSPREIPLGDIDSTGEIASAHDWASTLHHPFDGEEFLRETIARLRRTVAKKPKHLAILDYYLSRFGEVTYSEVADEVGCSPATVKRVIADVRRQWASLKQVLLEALPHKASRDDRRATGTVRRRGPSAVERDAVEAVAPAPPAPGAKRVPP